MRLVNPYFGGRRQSCRGRRWRRRSWLGLLADDARDAGEESEEIERGVLREG
jgi:hypothetical protein